jgi:hypothetical protein
MPSHQSVEIFVAIQTLVIAISHIAQPRAWVAFFVWLRGKGHAGVFANGFLSLWFGAFIVAFHQVWTGPALIVTLLGWAQVVKGTIAFVLPQVSMLGFQRVSHERRHEFVVAGAGLLVFSGFCWYAALSR